MKSLSEYVNEKLNDQLQEAKIGQKDFKSIKIGDVAIHDDGDKAGKILWKGSLKELKSSKYKYLTNDFDEGDLPDDYNWVVVDGGHVEGPTLMNYMEDPSGVYVNEALENVNEGSKFDIEDLWAELDDVHAGYEREEIGESGINGKNSIQFIVYEPKFGKTVKKYLDSKNIKYKQNDNVFNIQESLEDVNEADITSDEQFKEYGKEVLKNAHGEDFDEDKAEDTLQGILDDSDGDYGVAIGKLQSSLGESLNENAKMSLWEFYDSNIDDSKNETDFIKLAIKAGFNESDVEAILGDVEQGLSDDELKTYYSKIKNK